MKELLVLFAHRTMRHASLEGVVRVCIVIAAARLTESI